MFSGLNRHHEKLIVLLHAVSGWPLSGSLCGDLLKLLAPSRHLLLLVEVEVIVGRLKRLPRLRRSLLLLLLLLLLSSIPVAVVVLILVELLLGKKVFEIVEPAQVVAIVPAAVY